MALLPSYNIKEIIELVKKGADVEAQEKILELREAALELQEENLELKEKMKQLEQQQEIKDSLDFDGAVYWLKKENVSEGPYCQACMDNDGKSIRLQKTDALGYLNWHCAVCDKFFSKI